MTQFDDSSSPPASPSRRRGPKPIGSRPMTGAERTRAYRQRLLEDQDLEAPSKLSAIALREKLNRALLELDRMQSGRAKLAPAWKDIEADLLEGAQYAAQQVWQEVGRRYGFKFTKAKSSR